MKIYQRHKGNYALALKKASEANQAFATARQGIDERMRQGVDADISKNGAGYNASFNEVSGRILGTKGKFNPLIDYAEQAVESMRTGEFYLNGVLINGKPASEVLSEIAEQDAKKPIHRKRVADFGKMKTHNVPTDCFGDDDVISFLAESKARAEKYGLWLRNKAGITESKVHMQDIIGKNKSRGFWLCRLDDVGGSDFFCSDRYLYYEDSVFGVRESAEGTQKNLQGYTPAQARQYLKILNDVMAGRTGTSRLEEVARLFKQK